MKTLIVDFSYKLADMPLQKTYTEQEIVASPDTYASSTGASPFQDWYRRKKDELTDFKVHNVIEVSE